ncbi:unnamed protein product, partial [Mesorhabditis spiculigera]
MVVCSALSDYDYKGRDYVKEKADRLVFGLWGIKDLPKMLEAYDNEEITGKAFKELLPKHNLTREDIFLATKIHNIHQGPLAEPSLIESMKLLQVDYLDLVLIHWPGVFPVNHSEPKRNQTGRKETWQTLEKFYGEGKLKAIGVSNYMTHHLEDLLSYAKVFPAVDQCEFHFHYQVNSLVKFCKEKGIIFQAYFCALHLTPEAAKSQVEDKLPTDIAAKYNISSKLLQFAYPYNLGMSVMMRATSPKHIIENLKAKEIKLEQADIDALTLKNTTGHKNCGDPKFVTDSDTVKIIEA